MITNIKPLIVFILILVSCYGSVVDGVKLAGESSYPKEGGLNAAIAAMRNSLAPQPPDGPDEKLTGLLTDTAPAFMPTYRLAQKIRSGEISSSRITGIYLNRIAKYNHRINAIVTLDADKALSKHILWGPLHSVPVTIKDKYHVKGRRATAGYPPLKDNIPEKDATRVKRLCDAGAIIMGETIRIVCDNKGEEVLIYEGL